MNFIKQSIAKIKDRIKAKFAKTLGIKTIADYRAELEKFLDDIELLADSDTIDELVAELGIAGTVRQYQDLNYVFKNYYHHMIKEIDQSQNANPELKKLAKRTAEEWQATMKGVVSYVKLNDWCMNHLLTSENGKSKFRYGAAMIKKKGCQNELKEGKFEATDEEFLAADEIHAELLEITELFGLKGKGSWLEALAISWAEIREQHDFREWMKEFKVKKQKLMKLPKTNQKEWNTIFATVHMAIDKKKVC